MVKELLEANERFPHKPHQLIGVEKLLEQPAFFLADQVGAAKSKQVVDTAQILFLRGDLDTVLAVTPGGAKSTWADPSAVLGEVAKHAWTSVPNVVQEYHAKTPVVSWTTGALVWIVTNYEFIRRDERLESLLKQLVGRRTWLVLDEAAALCHNSDQMRACRKLRVQRAERVTLLNGTPLADGKAVDLFYPFLIMDPDIIGIKSMFQFKARYCVMGGFKNKQIVGYRDLDDLNKRIAPYVLARKTREHWDLPPMLEPIVIEAPLSESTWTHYKEMRDDMVTWLKSPDGSQATSVAAQAIVKTMRLAQLTSGYLGGLEQEPSETWFTRSRESALDDVAELPEWLRAKQTATQGQGTTRSGEEPRGPIERPSPGAAGAGLPATREVSREKLDALLAWLLDRVRPEKLLVWCRFRLEGDRAARALKAHYPLVARLAGGQKPEERRAAKELLAPGGTPGRAAVVGNQRAGGVSLNLSQASTAVYLSNGLSLMERTQSIGRVERPGQQNPIQIVDVVATGPKGQKTIDHAILKALKAKDDMAQWTVNQWRRIYEEE